MPLSDMRSLRGRRDRSHVQTETAEASERSNEETNADRNDGTEDSVLKQAATAQVWECVGFKQNEQGVSS